MLPDSEQQTRAWRVMLRGEMEHAMAQHTRFMEEQTRTIMSEIAGSLLAQVREMSGAIGQRVDALEVQASQADELVAHRLTPAQFTAMAQRQANTEMRLRHAEEQVRAQEERTGARKIHVDKVAAQFEAKVCTLQQLVDMQSGQLREMREQRMHEGETLRDNDIQIEAVNSLSMNQQPLLEVLGRNVQGMQCLLAMDRDKRDAEIAGMRASMEKTQTGRRADRERRSRRQRIW